MTGRELGRRSIEQEPGNNTERSSASSAGHDNNVLGWAQREPGYRQAHSSENGLLPDNREERRIAEQTGEQQPEAQQALLPEDPTARWMVAENWLQVRNLLKKARELKNQDVNETDRRAQLYREDLLSASRRRHALLTAIERYSSDSGAVRDALTTDGPLGQLDQAVEGNSVGLYNSRVDHHNRMIEAGNRLVEAHNRLADALRGDQNIAANYQRQTGQEIPAPLQPTARLESIDREVVRRDSDRLRRQPGELANIRDQSAKTTNQVEEFFNHVQRFLYPDLRQDEQS